MKTPKHNAPLESVVDYYLLSDDYRRLRGGTQKSYHAHLQKALDTYVDGRRLGSYRINRLKVRHFQIAYDQWLDIGVRTANLNKACIGIAWRHAMRHDVMTNDPIALVKGQATQPRRVRWTREQIKQFLDVAYSDFRWRSMGLMFHMAYDWGQRVGDMRLLTWDKLDLEQCRLDLTQSKRNAEVHLPISQNLCLMLRQQKEDLGFQKYVAPKVSQHNGSTRAYILQEVAEAVNQIKKEAGLPKELTAMDLRRTAVTEMMEGGVDLVGIMQVTGHQNVASVKNYMVNTFSGASKALAARGNDDD